MRITKLRAAVLVGIIVVASFITRADAATLTFENTASNAAWFSILQIPADTTKTPIVYMRAHPTPGVVGPTTIVLPGVAGDCYWVTAIARGGPSMMTSNRACIGEPPANGNAEKLEVKP